MFVDNICKYLAQQYPESFANWVLGETISDANILKSELSVEPIRADFVALLRPQERILHLEFQVEAVSDPPLPLRMLDYYVRLYRQYNRPVDQFVLFLKRTGSTSAYADQLITDSITYRYRVIRLWEQDPAPLLANPALLPLATLAQSDSPNTLLEQVSTQLDMIESREQRSNISACVEILAGLRFEIETIRQFITEDIMRESVVYQEIIREGVQRGIQQGKQEEARSFTMRLLTRRIGEVAPDLQAQIQNLTTTQLEELGVALLDFNNADALTAWLQNQS
ncbi:Rpn family recombination-promoting nuclease/putative transposase [Chroococcidiopsidales cyanobacterium LEGE 13417]|nr:Rpn family recombination-promoting nuclease/putative transposase [Chroococcidiopsidales cyanobacterium LEGE 13417]